MKILIPILACLFLSSCASMLNATSRAGYNISQDAQTRLNNYQPARTRFCTSQVSGSQVYTQCQ